MNLWDTVTGNDMTREFRALQARADQLPADFRSAWDLIVVELFPYGSFTGRNLMPVLEGVIGLLEESQDQPLSEVLGDDIPGFAAAVAGGSGAASYRDRWRRQLGDTVARKLGDTTQGGKP